MAEVRRVYLDHCCVCRPFDGTTQERILRESWAVMRLYELQEQGKCKIVISPVHRTELARIRDLAKGIVIESVLDKLEEGSVEESLYQGFGTRFIALGLGTLDAYHLACATILRVDVFLTCDDGICRKKRDINTIEPSLHVENVLEWVDRLEESWR